MNAMPVIVRASLALLPTELVTVRTRGSRTLDDVRIEFVWADARLKARSAGDPLVPHLSPSESIDLFFDHRPAGPMTSDREPLTYRLKLEEGGATAVFVYWKGVDGTSDAGQLAIVLTAEDREGGLPPALFTGERSQRLYDYMTDPTAPMDPTLLQKPKRVRMRSAHDARRQIEEAKPEGDAMKQHTRSPRYACLSLEGLRGFRDTADLKLAIPNGKPGSGLTLVVGANNTGKSTAWEAFDAITRKLRSDVSFSEGKRNRGSAQGVSITLGFTDHSSFNLRSRNANTSETRSLWSPEEAQRPIEIVTVPSRRQFQPMFSKALISQRDWMGLSNEFTRVRQNDQFTGRLFDVHNDDEKKRAFDELLARVLGEPLAWSIELGEGQFGQSYYVKVITGEGVNHNSEGLGDGIVSLMYVLNALYDSAEDTLLVLDEPELSLHPQLIRRLRSVLSEYASKRQIVVFTHSPHLVSWDDILNGAEIARVHKEDSASRISQPDRTVISELSKARGGWKNPHTLGTDATEALFLDDNIIVVEGQEDAKLLPVVYQDAGIDLRGTVFGWGAGGGDANPRRILALLDGLGFTRVVALLDADKNSEADAITQAFPRFMAVTIPADDIRDKPANNYPGKSGLLDQDGRHIKPELIEGTQTTLRGITMYFNS